MKYEVQENCLTIFLPSDLDHHNAEEIKKEADHLVDRNNIRYIINAITISFLSLIFILFLILPRRILWTVRELV